MGITIGSDTRGFTILLTVEGQAQAGGAAPGDIIIALGDKLVGLGIGLGFRSLPNPSLAGPGF
jgi:hypothetical protein